MGNKTNNGKKQNSKNTFSQKAQFPWFSFLLAAPSCVFMPSTCSWFPAHYREKNKSPVYFQIFPIYLNINISISCLCYSPRTKLSPAALCGYVQDIHLLVLHSLPVTLGRCSGNQLSLAPLISIFYVYLYKHCSHHILQSHENQGDCLPSLISSAVTTHGMR